MKHFIRSETYKPIHYLEEIEGHERAVERLMLFVPDEISIAMHLEPGVDLIETRFWVLTDNRSEVRAFYSACVSAIAHG
jgi:hypothetical protein